jgi:hypothetical protein
MKLQKPAYSNRRSISAEPLSLLEQLLPTASEVRRRAAFYQRIQRLRLKKSRLVAGPSAEELPRADRER